MGLFQKIFGTKIADQITPSCDDAYNALLRECVAEVEAKNQKMSVEYGLGSYERWAINQEVGDLIFSNNGIPQVVCKVQILGSFSDNSKTWMWGWANNSILEGLTNETMEIKRYGERNKIEDLIIEKTEATDGEAWALASLGCRILGGLGLYRGPTGKGFVVMMIKELKRCE